MKQHFYRIGRDNGGLWYTPEGQFTGTIHTPEFQWLSASKLEMPFDKNIVGYISVADSLQHLYTWFPKEEIIKLQELGFVIEEWAATDVEFYEPYQHNVIKQDSSVLVSKLVIVN